MALNHQLAGVLLVALTLALGPTSCVAFSAATYLGVQSSRLEPLPRIDKPSGVPALSGSVVLRKGRLEFSDEMDPSAVAWGSYIDSSKTASNFGKLRIVTSRDRPDSLQMTAAGFLEGWLTAERIFDQHTNVASYFAGQLYPGVDLSPAMTWLDEQEQWLHAQVSSSSSTDPQWRAVGLVMAQFDGLVQGYQARCKWERAAAGGEADSAVVGWLERGELSFLNNNGELYDIVDHLLAQQQTTVEAAQGQERKKPIKSRTVTPEQAFDIVALKGRCSALVKVLGDLSDVFIGHSTWDSFTNALRIFKHYEFNLNDPDVHSRRLSFSSYPGELFSDDDLYISDSGIVMVETTLHVFKPDLYESLSIQTIPSWYRVRMAFLRATSGEEWVRFFSAYNSGTYNNQYMVVDLNRFIPNQELQKGFLWVVEQIPDLVSALDATELVSYAYWPSYNVPYFEQIYNATGYPDLIKDMQDQDPVKYEGEIRWFRYQISPRAAMFRRDQGRVHSLKDMKDIMRYNDWRKDPYAYGKSHYTICGRYDLLEEDAKPTGCYDSKVTSYYLAQQLEAEVVNGPALTTDNVPFAWDGRWANPKYVHRGHPQVFNFEYERMTIRDLPLPVDDVTWGTQAASLLKNKQ